MAGVFLRSVPFDMAAVTMALEAGVDGLVVPACDVAKASQLSRCTVVADEDVAKITLQTKQDEIDAAEKIRAGAKVIINEGWEVIPIENLLAQSDRVWVEADNAERAKLASGILEKGVEAIVVPAAAADQVREIVRECKVSKGKLKLVRARITRIAPAGLGHRVCADTISILRKGQGMLVGNSNAFTFLVHAETEHNEYVASRPFRVNAGAVHAYVCLPGDRTVYLEELRQGQEVLIVDAGGNASITALGRVKIEVRPMLLVEAETADPDSAGGVRRGCVFLQNAETIRLTGPDGEPKSVVDLKEGDEVLCRVDDVSGGRHFGMRISEDIKEV